MPRTFGPDGGYPAVLVTLAPSRFADATMHLTRRR
ncbi:MAG: hypothetical protein QOI09_594 [Chloroflexota bacterium]|jgi:hypothetical protein|nr:hypothetical protein [Chloroflexota bacterium]